ncbi:MAG: NAD(P)/FAD-dependent oxidoreductase, partial [Chloroflexi bacterium]|nr:NAD(P)/FAD-dependent oxidoreductase [Chloroflexota bacterium]
VVLGGRMTGCETAEFLAERGNTVTIVARSSQIAPNVELLNRAGLLKELRKKNVEMLTRAHDITGFTVGGIELVDKTDGSKKPVEADWVVVARGVECCGDLCSALEGKVSELYTVGDAKEPRKIMDAIYEGAVVGRQI